ncbi:MAG: phenylacetate--CoA ligase [Actinobacteria bacterium]|nr:phenylacetate--CoA ligase [Actinomycetota bacterium]
MKKTFMPEQETWEQLRWAQLDMLQWSVRHAYQGSHFYRRRFDQVGVAPANIRTVEQIRSLPFTTAHDLQEDYPFPLLAVPHDQLVRIHSSSGTTGRRKILGYTQKDVDDWADMFARCYEMAGVGPGDRVQIMVGYGLWTAGVGFQAGCERAGAMAVPVGPGNLELQIQFLLDMQSNVICCTASMALLVAEELEKRDLVGKTNIQTVILGSEVCGDAMRARILELTGATDLYDIPGMTELYGPGTGLDCRYHTGIHYWADYYLLEILDPVTLEPVPEGEIGEMVVTTLRKEGAPLIRYRTRDLTRLIPGQCECGSILPRHDRLMGRSDDMFKYRAVNIYPGQIESILSKTEGVSCEYNVRLTMADGKHQMTVLAERLPGADSTADAEVAQNIADSIKKEIMVTAEVQVVDYGSLPRSERKSKRVYDERETQK